MGETESDDDFYVTYEEYLDDDEISAKEEAFMRGFTRVPGNEPDELIEVEIEDIDLEFDMEDSAKKEGYAGEEEELEVIT